MSSPQRSRMFLMIALLASACGSGASDTDSASDSADGSDDTPPPEPGTRFETSATTWTVPSTGAGTAGYFATSAYSGYDGFFSLVDMDGDRLPDLVSTAPANPDSVHVHGTGAGVHWKVFRNTGEGFETSATTWTVPTTGAGTAGYFATSAYSGYDGFFSLVDMDGDRLPDLVSTAPANPDSVHVHGTGAGVHWKVFRNTGDGFETSATTWTVPSTGAGTAGYFATSAYSGYDGFFSLVDMDGDRLPDLVSTAPANPDSVHVHGTGAGVHWKVFRNTGDGFETSATTWTVPTTGAGTAGYFATSAYSGYDGFFSLVDMDGDRLPDLVSTAPANPDSVHVHGTGAGVHWKVFRNTGDGFETSATTWTVPTTGAGTAGYFATSAYSGYDGFFSLVDMDGDRLPDLVSTAPANPDSVHVHGTGAGVHWKVFRNTGDGFETSATTWTVPTTGAGTAGYFATSAYSGYDGFFSLVDMDDDRLPDLVSTAPANPDSVHVHGTGAGVHWKVFLGAP